MRNLKVRSSVSADECYGGDVNETEKAAWPVAALLLDSSLVWCSRIQDTRI